MIERLKMTTLSIFTFFLLTITLHAEDGHELWLRGHSTESVNVVCSKQSATLDIARQELVDQWRGKSETLVVTIISDPHILIKY